MKRKSEASVTKSNSKRPKKPEVVQTSENSSNFAESSNSKRPKKPEAVQTSENSSDFAESRMAATSFVCLLRGINVAGSNVLKMPVLAKLFSDEGFLNPKTYIQSGNIVFTRPAVHPIAAEELESHIHECIRDQFGYNVPVWIRTKQQISDLISQNPFIQHEDIESKQLHVTFLSEPYGSVLSEKLDHKFNADTYNDFDATFDIFKSSEDSKHIFLHTPNGYGKTKLNNNVIEKACECSATTRNWNTCLKLFQMITEM
ncbi:hypothetical protein HK100_012228 [Physocladia obscura]|uniref:DUF1697 domain-containing protein n=1 Tax=Physocladia obscura TaxID=109957 RepID=A0AAD5T020_9FUNG|nr:hypothetical protein HK100_012228 [Physocladia obscura]